MKFSHCQVFLLFVTFVSPISALEIEKIADGLDNIFLGGNFTADEAKSILELARGSYRILTAYSSEVDPNRKRELLTGVKIFANNVVEDLANPDLTLRELFSNINSYLKGVWNASKEDGKSLKTTMPVILGLLDQKIGQQHSQPLRKSYDVKGILSGSGEDIFRGSDNINPTTVGYFFLEAFATIFGLSWGIISMILSDSE